MSYCLLLFVSLGLSSINALPVNLDNEVYEVDIRLIEESHIQPMKRSVHDQALNLPDHLVFGVPVEKNKADTILRLKKKPLIPTVTTDGRGYIGQQNASVYTDVSSFSSMIVSRDDGQYSLQGTFAHSGKEWNLQPMNRHSRSSASHQLSPLRPKEGQRIISFGRDYEVVNEIAKGKASQRNITRHKRDEFFIHHVIEISFVADFADYTKFDNMFGSSMAATKMQLWYSYIAHSMNIRYETIVDPNFSVSIKAQFLQIIVSDDDDDFIDDIQIDRMVEGGDALSAFRTYVESSIDIPNSDHYMFFTGFDIINVVGLSYTSAVCEDYNYSVLENTNDGTAGLIAAHELGHSLSAIHDSEACDDADQFIMATSVQIPIETANEGNAWTFSSCSLNAFSGFLASAKCTFPDSTTSEDYFPPMADGDRPGEVLTPDIQCRMQAENQGSGFCSGMQTDLSTLCAGMYCTATDGSGSCYRILPQEFTPCGTALWCVLGRCVDAPTTAAPTTTTATTTTATTTTTVTTTTEDPNPEPTKIWMCLGRIFTDWREWWRCTKEALGRIFG